MIAFPGTRRWLKTVLAAGLLALPACLPPAPSTRSTSGAANSDIAFPLDDFTFTERSGKKVSKADLNSKVWVASFVFTRCTGPCPQVTATMARLQSELKDQNDVRLVTFTVDPARDDPAELRKYAEHFRADAERWLFLTGEEKELHHLLRENFKVAVTRNPKGESSTDEFDHSTRLVVVDRNGRVRGYFQGMADPAIPESQAELSESLQRLKAKVVELLAEKR